MYQWYETILKCLHHTSVVPQPFLFLIGAKARGWFLGWKCSLWPVPTWLVVHQSKTVFLLTLYDSINDMKYLWTVSITSQSRHSHFCSWWLLICHKLDVWAENVAYGLLTWLTVHQRKYVFLLNLYYSIDDMKHFQNFCNTPQPCHSHFCSWLLPIWPKMDFWLKMWLMACADLVGGTMEKSCLFHFLIW